MAQIYTCLLFTSFLLLSSSYFALSRAESEDPNKWFQTLPSRRRERSAVLHYYLHGAMGGPNPNIFEVARANITAESPTQFGQVRVLDDKMTAEPDRDLPELGRAQGMISSADLRETALALNINLVFTAGPFNGSTLCVVGRNPIGISRGRELAIVGGSGTFRMARGYLIENTYSFDPVENYFLMENTAYVYYYA